MGKAHKLINKRILQNIVQNIYGVLLLAERDNMKAAIKQLMNMHKSIEIVERAVSQMTPEEKARFQTEWDKIQNEPAFRKWGTAQHIPLFERWALPRGGRNGKIGKS